MNIQYVRLDDDLCEILNRLAEEQGRKVSELVNELLRTGMDKSHILPPTGRVANG